MYGFYADPDKSLTYNFNQAIKTRDNRLIQNQPTNLSYHNLCTQQQPPNNTGQLLGLNLKYCIAPPTPKPDLPSTVGKLIRSVRTQSMLVQRKVKSSQFLPQLYKKNAFYSPPLATDEIEFNLSKFDSLLEQAATALPKKCRSNLTPTQYKLLQELKGNPDFIILPSDKNLGPAIMNRKKYMEKVLTEHLLSPAYRNMPPLEANVYLSQTRKSLQSLYRTHSSKLSIAERQYFERSFTETHRNPMFYIIPKVQKQPVKYRPVVSCVKSFNAIFSTWLDFKMKALLQCIPTYLKDSNDLLKDLSSLPKLPPSARLFTADATAMYTNIDTATALEAFNFLFDHYKKEIPEDFPRDFFLKALEIVMNRNLFQFDDTYWLQLDGTAMGTPTACLHATISYGVHERNKILPSYSKYLLFYKRFIDDVIGIWDGSDNETWEQFQQAMNSWGKLKWVISERSKKADFLDLTISIEHGKILTRTFQKSMNLYLYIPPISAHPTSCFKGLIVGNFLRFRKQNNDENFCTLIANFAKHLLARGHTIKAIKRHFLHAAATTDKSKLQKIPNKQQKSSDDEKTTLITNDITNRSLYLHWQYHPAGIQRDQLRVIFDKTLKECNPFAKGMTIAMSRPKNLRDLLTRTVLNEPAGKRASDYYQKLLCPEPSPTYTV